MVSISDRKIAFIAIFISIIALIPGGFQVYEFFEQRERNLQIYQHQLSISKKASPSDGNFILDGNLTFVNSSKRSLTLDSFYCRIYSKNLPHRRDHLCRMLLKTPNLPSKLNPGETVEFKYQILVSLPQSIRHIADKVLELDPDISSLDLAKIVYLWFQSDPLSEIEVSSNIELFYETLKDNFESGWEIAPGPMGGITYASNYIDGEFDRFFLRRRDVVEIGDPPGTGELKLSFFTSTVPDGPYPLGEYDFKFY